MAIKSKFGFTNTSVSDATISPTKMEMTTNYALVEDEPTSCVLSNVTAPIDQGELVSFKCQSVRNVSTKQDILHPSKVQAGIQYVVKVEEILSTTSDSDPTFRVDTPIVAYLTVRHPKDGVITGDMVATVVSRLLGACRKDDGTWRFDDLMRSSLRPTE